MPLDDTAALLARQAELGIATAWVGSYEALLHRDIAGVNARLAEECVRSAGRLLPFGAVNLSLPDWDDDVRRCHEVHRMPGVRLLPNYHGYTLADPSFVRLLTVARERGLVVQIAASMEDPRTQHPLAAVPDVDLRPLPDAMRAAGAKGTMILNASRSVPGPLLKSLAGAGACFDTARVEGVGGIAAFLRGLPPGRVAFGTHAPFFNPETGLLKVFEAQLAPAETAALLGGTARAFLGR
ncbi:MAG: amidohydrolase family protein [Opitutaceae bacterium]|nr:amidohydrolase family protein [Opitutaceae bacterium]